MREIYTDREVFLCATHLRCAMCREVVRTGRFALGVYQVACTFPAGTPDRLQTTCAFRCDDCGLFLLKQDLAEPFRLSGADDDEDLSCDDCLKECALCEKYAHCRTVLYGSKQRDVCSDCVRDDEGPRVSVSLVRNHSGF